MESAKSEAGERSPTDATENAVPAAHASDGAGKGEPSRANPSPANPEDDKSRDDTTSKDMSAGKNRDFLEFDDALPEDDLEATDKKGRWKRFLSLFRVNLFSSLTRRIVFLNLIALVVLLSGIMYMNQFREGLIDTRVESLLTQGRIIASAIAASATVETNAITIDPDKLLELDTGQSIDPSFDTLDNMQYSVDPEKFAPVLRRLIQPTRTRARIYDAGGDLIIDSRYLYAGGQVLRYNLENDQNEPIGSSRWVANILKKLFQRTDLPTYTDVSGPENDYPEVKAALKGESEPIERVTKSGELIVSVAVPIQRYRIIYGALLLSTQGGDIDRIVAEERLAVLRVFLIASVVTIILSLLLASTIGNPLRKLSDAADRVRTGVKSRVEIPDFSSRQDEIGHLSTSLRDMTSSLYARMEAIERFAADVSHELKNPLTSLRSAVETLPLARTEDTQKRLMDVIQHDVKRLDRLITDISDASRLDAELAREDSTPVDLAVLIRGIVETARNTDETRVARLKENGESDFGPIEFGLNISRTGYGAQGYHVLGHDVRLGQVFDNLISNARSFVPAKGGRIAIRMARSAKAVVIVVQDNGPGISAENPDRIFERFYTDRPASEQFGQNSGLGLSISRQIIEAHGGTISVSNLSAEARKGGKADAGTDDQKTLSGAKFLITLPADSHG